MDFHRERHTNAAYASTTDPEALLYKKAKGRETKLCYLGHALKENRHGLLVGTYVAQATGTAEREAAPAVVAAIPGQHRLTLGAEKNYDTRDFARELRELRATSHVAQHMTGRSSAIGGRMTHPSGYTISQRRRKRVEESFGGLKATDLLRKTRHFGVIRVGWVFPSP